MRFPVFWLATAYAAGLALYAGVDPSHRALFLLSIVTLIAGAMALHFRRHALTFALVLVGFLLAGGAAIGFDAAAVAPNRIDRLLTREPIDLSEAVRATGWLRRGPARKPLLARYDLELESIETGGRRWETSGGLRLTFFEPPGARRRSLPPLHYGDRVEVLAQVHEPINRQNPGSFDWRAYLARQEIFLEGSLRGPELLTRLEGRRGSAVMARLDALRLRLLEQLDKLVPRIDSPDANAVLRAMLLGDRGFLDHRVAEDFRHSGAYHVLVISGLHVGVLAVFLFWLLRGFGAHEYLVTALTIATLVFYLLLVEDRPPIERAVWMVSLYLVARLLYREVRLSNPLSLAALVLLFLHPQWLFDPSFQFSFGAVLMIAFFAVPWIERTSKPYRDALSFVDTRDRDAEFYPPHLAQFRHDLRATADLLTGLAFWADEKERALLRLLSRLVRAALRAWDILVLTFAIYLVLVLLTAVYFQQVFLAGLLTNLLVVPLVGIIVPFGLIALLLGLLVPALGAAVGWLVSSLVGCLLGLVEFFAQRGLSYGIPAPPPWLILLYLAALALFAVAVDRHKRQRWALAALAVPALLVVLHPFPPQLPPNQLELTVLDVGQGDSLFLAFPNGETWLLDAGRGPLEQRDGSRIGEAVGETVVRPFLRARGLKRLGRVWLSHAHHDHMAGLTAVLDEFPVRNLNVGLNPPSRAYQELLATARGRGIPVLTHHVGERFAVGEIEVEILWPQTEPEPGAEPSNNDSLVLRLCRKASCLLLPGDIEAKIEKQLALAGAPLAARVLKVPHHGGRGAASEEFLAAVHPEVAVVSVGATNPFGHPFPEVAERLRAAVPRVFRTDRDGAVTVRLGHDGLEATSFAETNRAQLYPSLAAKLAACVRRLLALESR
jgi:competence protein ComEC